MAPKKKGNKRQEQDWEAELGEDAPAAEPQSEEEPAAEGAEEETSGSGGLLAALRKNKTKKAKKGKQDNDFVEGEDPTEEANDAVDLASKAPQEGSFEDEEEDVFAGNQKSAKAAAAAAKAQKTEEPEGEFRVKSKKEKEKEKKEREKQRKKEQVGYFPSLFSCIVHPCTLILMCLFPISRPLLRRSLVTTRKNPPEKPLRPRMKPPQSLLPPLLLLRNPPAAARRRSSPPTWQLSRSSRKHFGNSVKKRSEFALKRGLR